MFKPNNKKMLTVLITVATIFSAFAVLSLAAEPAYAQTASGTISYTPNIVTAGQVYQLAYSSEFYPVIYASGGTFSGVSEFYFYWSTTDSVTGIIDSAPAFTYTTLAGATTFSNSLLIPSGTNVTTSGKTVSPGETLYLIASTSGTVPTGSSVVMGSTPFTVSLYNPQITLASTSPPSIPSIPAGQTALVSGSGFNPSATSATVYFAADGTPPVDLGTVKLVTGLVAPRQYVTIPNDVQYGEYYVYAVDSVSSEDAGAVFTLTESITVAPLSISGATSSTFTITGYGFPATSVIGTSAVSLSGPSSAGTVLTSAVTVPSDGEVTLPVIGLTASLASYPGSYTITIALTGVPPSGGPSSLSFASAIFVSVPGVDTSLTVYDIQTSPTSTSTSGVAGDLMKVIGVSFAPSQSGTFYFDGVSFPVTTDSNGFFELVGPTVVIPTVPAGSQAVYANVGGLSAKATFTVETNYQVLNSAFADLNDEFAAIGSTVYVSLSGLSAHESVNVIDLGLATEFPFSGGSLATLAFFGLVSFKVNDGTFVPLGNDSNFGAGSSFYANSEGYFNVSYKINFYSDLYKFGKRLTITPVVGGTSETPVTYYAATTGYDFYTGATSTFTGISNAGSALPGQTVELTFSTSAPPYELVPSGIGTTPGAIGFAGPYSVYFDSTLLTDTLNGKTTFTSSP
ncbi:MAG: hypothetical protein QXZ17_15425, partial [Nitrososphaerota archaeon]